MNFNERLKNIRKRAKVTQKSISEYLGVTLRTYQRYEEGSIIPPLLTICAISEYFNVPTDCLLGSGFFANWEEILHHKEEVLYLLKEKIFSLPDNFDLSSLTENQLAHILSTLFAKITFKDSEMTVFPLLPLDMFPVSILVDES